MKISGSYLQNKILELEKQNQALKSALHDTTVALCAVVRTQGQDPDTWPIYKTNHELLRKNG